MCVSAGGECRVTARVSLCVGLSVGTLGGQFWEWTAYVSFCWGTL